MTRIPIEVELDLMQRIWTLLLHPPLIAFVNLDSHIPNALMTTCFPFPPFHCFAFVVLTICSLSFGISRLQLYVTPYAIDSHVQFG